MKYYHNLVFCFVYLLATALNKLVSIKVLAFKPPPSTVIQSVSSNYSKYVSQNTSQYLLVLSFLFSIATPVWKTLEIVVYYVKLSKERYSLNVKISWNGPV